MTISGAAKTRTAKHPGPKNLMRQGGHTSVRDLGAAVEVEGGELRAPLRQGGHTGVRDFLAVVEVERRELRAP